MLGKCPRPAIALACLLSAALAPESALAFCRETSEAPPDGCECSHEGVPLYWQETQIAYALNERGFPGVSDRALRGALARSFAHWTDVTCDGEPLVLALKQLAESTTATKEYVRSGPNLNVIAQLSAQEFLAARGDRHAFALTTTAVINETGEIIDADTVFNAGLGPFAVCPDEGCPDDGTVDIENVATHEFGHFLGLAHSDVDEATMACTATRDELKKRSLEADDEAGICSIYAEPAIEERDEALHARSVHSGCGCRIDGTRGAAHSAVIGFLSLAALLRRRAQASSRRGHR